MIDLQSILHRLQRDAERTRLRAAERYAIARSPIRYKPKAHSAAELDRELSVAQANRAVGAPIFCVHGKLARIQCRRCG
jgi:hypothetical protein